MSRFFSLCQRDPLLELVQVALGDFTLLRRPSASLAPLDCFLVVPRGFGRDPQILPGGRLESLLSDRGRWSPPPVERAPWAELEAKESAAVSQRLSSALLEGLSEAVPPLGPELVHRYAGEDGLLFEVGEVEQEIVRDLGALPRFNTRHQDLDALRHHDATVFVVTGVLKARRLKLRRAQDRALLYDLRLTGGEDGPGAPFDLKDAATIDLSHDGPPLAFAFTGVRLRMTGDGSVARARSSQRVLLGDTPAGQAETRTAAGGEAMLAQRLALSLPELGEGDTPHRETDTMNESNNPRLPLLGFGSADLLAPAFDPGTTELRAGNNTTLEGLAQVTPDNGFRVEDSVVTLSHDVIGAGGQAAAGSLSRAAAGVSFASRAAFANGAWAALGWGSAQSALVQCASVQQRDVFPPATQSFLSALAAQAQGASVTKLEGLDGVGVALVGALEPGGPNGSSKRLIHVVVPAGFRMPPTVPVDMVASPPPPGVSLLAHLQSMGLQAPLQYARCDCYVGQVTGSWGLNQLMSPPPLGPMNLPGIT